MDSRIMQMLHFMTELVLITPNRGAKTNIASRLRVLHARVFKVNVYKKSEWKKYRISFIGLLSTEPGV